MKAIFGLVGVLLSLSSSLAAADPAATHGMLLFGKDKTYLSHLPMFHAPHDYQAIFEVKLPDGMRAAYLKELAQAGPGEIFTAEPLPFSLPEMAANPVPFMIRLYRGHFERGGKLFTRHALVEITRVIYFKKFDPEAEPAKELEYIAFGTPSEGYLAHKITAAPDFDHVTMLYGLPQEGIAKIPGANPAAPLKDNNRTVLDFGAKTVCLPVYETVYVEHDELAH